MIPAIAIPEALSTSMKVCQAMRDIAADRGPEVVTSQWEVSRRAKVEPRDAMAAVDRVAACGAPVRLRVDWLWIRLQGAAT